MGDSQQGKGKKPYNPWTSKESNMPLELMVDATNYGWRDSNGLLSKQIVESRILHVLNAKLGCQKTYHQYQGRLKWFKTRYHSFTQLMRHSSGFGWESISKKFTATKEVWQDYFETYQIAGYQ
ncbi:unnamed protein product [Prunus armeniaca]